VLRHRVESEHNAATHGRDADSKKTREVSRRGAWWNGGGCAGADVEGQRERGCKEQ